MSQNKLQSPRGTRDILPADQPVWQKIRKAAEETAQLFNFSPITTPTYEEAALFTRSIGDGTDIMDKELFLVKGIRAEDDAQYALRPEGTAGIIRAFIEHGMYTKSLPVKLYSLVNNFRYDRPQKGRYREHIQFDCELFGGKKPFNDALIIYLNWVFFQKIGLKNITLKLNTLGTVEERAEYIAILKKELSGRINEISYDSQRRLEVNPLRILDSKDPKDQKILNELPKLIDCLGADSLASFEEVKALLDQWKISYTVDPFLVRGLDYYSHTAFEWVITNAEGQQGSLGGGGRYDGLLVKLGGNDLGAVGSGIGLDRVVEEWLKQYPEPLSETNPEVFLITTAPNNIPTPLEQLIQANLTVEVGNPEQSIANQLAKANKLKAKYAVIVGEEEVTENKVTVKNLSSGEQSTIESSQLISALK